MLSDHWPLRRICVTTPRLELRLPSEEELAELAARRVHSPEQRPFLTPWTDLPPLERARHVLQQHWQRLGTWTPQDWALELAVFHQGRPVGVQDMRATDFAIRREVSQRLRLSRREWELTDRPPITVIGLQDCGELFGSGDVQHH